MMKFQKTVCDISFSEKVRIFSHDYLKCCIYISNFSSSQVLEDFLDFHGAKNNTNLYFYRELSAAVRHLSLGGYSQTHILNRLDFYGLPDSKTFEEQGTATLYFLRKSLTKLAPVIIKEAQRLNIPLPHKDRYDMDQVKYCGESALETHTKVRATGQNVNWLYYLSRAVVEIRHRRIKLPPVLR